MPDVQGQAGEGQRLRAPGFGAAFWARELSGLALPEVEARLGELIASVRLDEASKCRALIVPADDAPRRWIAERIRLHRKALRGAR